MPALRQAQAPEAEAGEAALMLRNGRASAKVQAFALFAANDDGTDLALATAIGCQPKTIKRYRQEWATRQRRRLEPLPTRHHGNPAPWRALAATILRRAVLDYKLGHRCGEQCRPGQYHRCASDAALFLTGPVAGFLFDAIPNVSQEQTLCKLGLGVDNGND